MKILTTEPELLKDESSEYETWLENMVILLAKSYQTTYDMLLKKLENKETDAFFHMPAVQGFDMMLYAIEKIAQKANNKGTTSSDKLDGYVNYLVEKYGGQDE